MAANDHEDCHKKSSHDWDLDDDRRETTLIQNHHSTPLGSPSEVRGHGCVSLGCVSRGNLLDVSGCLRSKLTVWKEEQFTVLPGHGIKQREKRVPEWVAKVLPLAKPGVWGCVQARAQWSTEEDAFMRPGHHWLCEFGDAGNDTSCVKQFNLVLSSSSGDSTEWRRMCQDSRSKSGHRTLTHHVHLWLC